MKETKAWLLSSFKAFIRDVRSGQHFSYVSALHIGMHAISADLKRVLFGKGAK